MHHDSLWISDSIATCGNGIDLIKDAAIAVKNGLISWIGPASQLPSAPDQIAKQVHNVSGCITPGLIDCHTHIVYAGNRAHEFEMRLKGISYEEISKQGGGIKSTVAATRQASEEDLFLQSLKRVQQMQKSGVTTIEIKSGYGLDLETELKMLRVAKRIEQTLPITVKKTFLGAHTVPVEYTNRAHDYVDFICHEMIPMIASERYADAIDVFCEKIAFDLDQTEKIFQAAQKFHLDVKCHSEQLSDSKSAVLASKYNALSVDHLEHLSEAGAQAMNQSGTTAVLLPGAFYFLRETKKPPVALFRKHDVPIAIASDCNPGTSPILSMPLVLNMACTLFDLTPEEAFLGATFHAAKALGIQNEIGSLAVGKRADLAIWDVSHPNEITYYLGGDPCVGIVKNGLICHR